MRAGPSRRDELVANTARERQIGESRMQVAELAPAEPEFDTAEAVAVGRDAFPTRNRCSHCFSCGTGRTDGTFCIGEFHKNKGATSSALEIKQKFVGDHRV